MLPGFPIPMFATLPAGVEYIGSATFGYSRASAAGGSRSVSYPSGTQPGDLVVALAVCSSNANASFTNPRYITGPEGWAPVYGGDNARYWRTSSYGVSWQTLMRVAQAGDGSFTFSANYMNQLNVTLVTFRGVGLPLDAVVHGTVTTAGSITGPTVVADTATLLLMGAFSNGNTTAPTITGPGSATQLVSYTQGSGDNGATVNWMGMEEGVSAGAVGTRAWTENSTSNVMSILSLAAGTPGTWLYDSVMPSTGNWVVPAGVTSVNILCVGSGGCSYPGAYGFVGGSGGGGAYAYSNNVAVTPGETLYVNVGQSLAYASQSTTACASYVSRSGTPLVRADYGRSTNTAVAGGAGGSGASSIGGAKGSGNAGNVYDGTGGSMGAMFSLPSTPTGSSGQGLNPSLSTVLSLSLGGRGAGARQDMSSAIDGGDGLVIITWGHNREFGQSGGRFI